jgi:hypothetical protein
MSDTHMPLIWATGDRCVVDGHIGRVLRVRDGFAMVRRDDGLAMYRPLLDLELVASLDAQTPVESAAPSENSAPTERA